VDEAEDLRQVEVGETEVELGESEQRMRGEK
jgi:hypothetical protein